MTASLASIKLAIVMSYEKPMTDDDYLAIQLREEAAEREAAEKGEQAVYVDDLGQARIHTFRKKEPKKPGIFDKPKRPVGRPPKIAPTGTVVQLVVELPIEDREKFKQYCELRGKTMAGEVRRMVLEINATHENTPAELRREQFDAWVERNKNLAGFSLEKALERFRSIEAQREHEEVAEWETE